MLNWDNVCRARELRESGNSIRAIAAMMGFSKALAERILRAGRECRTAGELTAWRQARAEKASESEKAKRRARGIMPPGHRRAALLARMEELVNQGREAGEIARELGLSLDRTYHLMREARGRAGIVQSRKATVNIKKKAPERYEAALKAMRAGVPYAEIARALGVDARTVYKWGEEERVSRPPRPQPEELGQAWRGLLDSPKGPGPVRAVEGEEPPLPGSELREVWELWRRGENLSRYSLKRGRPPYWASSLLSAWRARRREGLEERQLDKPLHQRLAELKAAAGDVWEEAARERAVRGILFTP